MYLVTTHTYPGQIGAPARGGIGIAVFLFASAVVPLVGGLVLMRGGSRLGRTLPGGRGDRLRPRDVDPLQLKVGKRIELEHTSDPRLATEIALDHLAENPKYYTELCKIEPEEPACRLLRPRRRR